MDLSNINKKMFKYIIIVACVFIAIIAIFSISKLITGGKKLDYHQIEDKMKKAAESYVKDNENGVRLPENNEVLTIDVNDLVNNKNMKELDKYLKDKNIICSGKVIVRKQDETHVYIPTLDCGEAYQTTSLTDYIINKVEKVESGDGLYSMNNEYVYRGEYVNNYVKFANQLWRILRVDSDGNIRLLQEETKVKNTWDNRYNIDSKVNVGINDYSLSRINKRLSTLYNEIFTDEDKKYIATKNLCVGKRYIKDTSKDSSTECSAILENQKIGLIQINEFLLTSIDSNCQSIGNGACQNYNYLAKYKGGWWTITANSANTSEVYQITGSSSKKSNANVTLTVRPTIYINSDVIYVSGDGTKENPYIFK